MSNSLRICSFSFVALRLVFIAAVLLCWSLAAKAGSMPMKTVDHVDLKRYAGKWYEIARIPNRFQKKCARNVTAEYTLKGDAVEVQNACVKADDSTTVIRGKARVADKATNAKLRVTFFWPFSGDYWILGLDPDPAPDYRWAVVGAPGQKYLWILSRTPSLAATEMEQALSIAEQNGYSRASVVKTPQTGD
jgi:apolipoprotein D and lipocalin family protein